MNYWLTLTHLHNMIYLARSLFLKSSRKLSSHGVNRAMLVLHVLTNNKTSEPYLHWETEQQEMTEGNVLSVIQEITNVNDRQRGELSRVNINIHDYKVFMIANEKINWNWGSTWPKNKRIKALFEVFTYTSMHFCIVYLVYLLVYFVYKYVKFFKQYCIRIWKC